MATDSVELPPLGERKVSTPSSDDVPKVIAYLLGSSPDWGTLIAVLAWTGCRRGEVCALHWEDVDLDAGSILIRRSVAIVPGGAVERGTKTAVSGTLPSVHGPSSCSAHIVSAPPRAPRRAIQRWRTPPTSSRRILPVDGRTHQPVSPVSSRLRAPRPKAAHIRVHDLRHHSATTLLKKGASVGEVMDRHGWRTVGMVNRYRHLLEAQDAEAAKILEEA
ncbi:MAG TPA: site-specific integrase [Acidimicrobiales bacterium]|nr:site-specific integrase [Acidimicrobiales bacterium]